MSKIFITADWHLAEGAWKSRPEIAGDAFESLRRLVEQVDTGDKILAAGDLFDMKRPSADTVVNVASIFYGKSLSTFFIQGQHEFSKIPWLSLFNYGISNAHHVDHFAAQECFAKTCDVPPSYGWQLGEDADEVVVYAMDWSLSLNLQSKLDDIGKILDKDRVANPNIYRILMLHQTCNAVMAGTGIDREKILEQLDYRACELKDWMIPHGFDLIVVGDTHYHTEFQLIDKKGHLNRCLSPGIFTMQTVSETNTGQCFVLDTKTKEISSLELYRRPYKEVSIDTPVDFDKEIRGYIKAPTLPEFDIPIVQYTLYEKDADRIALLQQASSGKAHLFFRVIAVEQEEDVSDTSRVECLDDLVAHAIKESQSTDKAKNLLTDLINGNSPDEVLHAYYKETVL